ncbi:MAG: hypothetical protein PWP62_1138, partial [Eubacteriaceae bacterium]|nr:hypothetical protein [Eubacteriaceae bacterium]
QEKVIYPVRESALCLWGEAPNEVFAKTPSAARQEVKCEEK